MTRARPQRGDKDVRIIACRPLNPAALSDRHRRIWTDACAEMGYEPPIYDNSILIGCERCEVVVTVGPRQGEQATAWDEVGVPYAILCLMCCATTAIDLDLDLLDTGTGDEAIRVVNLGNPQPPTPWPGAAPSEP